MVKDRLVGAYRLLAALTEHAIAPSECRGRGERQKPPDDCSRAWMLAVLVLEHDDLVLSVHGPYPVAVIA
jgi:hypothetical protein